LLLLMPLHRHRGQVYIPLEILAATGLDRDTFLAGEDTARISAAIEAFAGLGRDHLARARTLGSRKRLSGLSAGRAGGPVLLKAQKSGRGNVRSVASAVAVAPADQNDLALMRRKI
jgi:phytoene synthase